VAKTAFHNDIYVLILGTRSQRWLASQLLCCCATGFGGHSLDRLPNHLLGETRRLDIPKEVMGRVIGPRSANIKQIMDQSSCFLFALGERPGKAMREVDEMDDLVEAMLDHVREGPRTEMIISGPARGMFIAENVLLSQIEDKFPGFFKIPPDCREIDGTMGLGNDKIWIDIDLESDASRTQADMLSGAAGCDVQSTGKLVFLAGTGSERARGREYLEWVAALRNGKPPHVLKAACRPDVVALTVPWLPNKQKKIFETELKKFSKNRKMLAFLGGHTDAAGNARLVLTGLEVLDGDVVQLKKDAESLVDATVQGRRYSNDLAAAESAAAWKENKVAWNESESQGWASWSWSGEGWSDGWSASVPPPTTPAGPGGVQPPMTPAGPASGVRPPMTPARPGGVRPPMTPASGVPLPATPGGAGFGPHASQAPCTPAPGGAFGPNGNKSPSTPGGCGFGVHGNSSPCTPAPGGLGRFGNEAPCTPGGPGVRPPQTPGWGNVPLPATPGFVPLVPAPQTPGMPRSQKMVPAPQTPGMPCSQKMVPAPQTPGMPCGKMVVPAPQTPGMPGGQKMVRPPQTPAAHRSQGTVPAPQTPAGSGKGVPAPHTPAMLTGARGPPPPQTPALGADSVPSPQTPANFGIFTGSAPAKCASVLRPTPKVLGASTAQGTFRRRASTG